MSDEGQNSIENVQAALRQLLQKQKEAAVKPAAPAQAESDDEELFVLDSSMSADSSPAFSPNPPQEESLPVAAEVSSPQPPPETHGRREVSPVSLSPKLFTRTEEKMSEERASSEDNQGRQFGGSATQTDAEAPRPVAIALDKQTVGATEHSFGALQQMLRRKQAHEHRERKVAITRGGNLTIEDIVRDEVRAFLKEWLDAHLASIVQAAVQKEIERLSEG